VLGGFLHNERADRELTAVAKKAQRNFARRAKNNGAYRHANRHA
jgi:hypothetical protein